MNLSSLLPATGHVPTASVGKVIPKNTDVLVVPLFTGDDGPELAASGLFEDDVDIAVWRQLVAVGARGTKNEITKVPGLEATGCGTIMAVGLGDSDDVDDETLRRAAGVAARALTGHKTAATTLGMFGLGATVEGFLLGAYDYKGLRKENEKAKKPVQKLTFVIPGGSDRKVMKEAKAEFVDAQIIAESVLFARDLVNTPPLNLYPAAYADIVEAVAKEEGLKVEVLDEKKLEKQGFGGIIAVGRGSARPPRLVRVSYTAKKAKKSVALVGKGITFDTGGISLKPGANMDNMTSDMAGSAAMVAAVIGAARLDLAVNVTATVALAENMPDGNAQRPGDVIRHYGGLTSEVLNTDAEGRLVLGDAIARACEDKPDYLIETATLTGAQMVALGTRTMGVMGEDDFRDRVAAHGRSVGELAWSMPLPEEIVEAVTGSDIADLQNTGKGRWGGMMAAGAYLQAFVSDGIPWAHLDVAGPAYNTTGVWGYSPKRATGVPVRTVLATLADIAKNG